MPVAWASAAAFLAVFAGLAFQLRQGRDPVLGAGHDGASAVVAPRRVLLRRVVKRRVIVRVIPAGAGAPRQRADGHLGAARERPTPVTSSPPPVAAAPARSRAGSGPRPGTSDDEVLVMAREYDMTFESMGSDVRLLVGPPSSPAAAVGGGGGSRRARVRRGLRVAPDALRSLRASCAR